MVRAPVVTHSEGPGSQAMGRLQVRVVQAIQEVGLVVREVQMGRAVQETQEAPARVVRVQAVRVAVDVARAVLEVPAVQVVLEDREEVVAQGGHPVAGTKVRMMSCSGSWLKAPTSS